MRRSLAGAVHRGDLAVRDRTVDILAGREDVRLAATVGGRAATGKVAHPVAVRIAAVGRSDRDDAVRIAGVGDADALIAGPSRTSVASIARVAGGGDDDHA